MAVEAQDKVVKEKTAVDRSKPTGHEEDDQDMVEQAWDGVSCQALDGKEAKRARIKEIGYVREKGSWRKIPRAEAIRRGITIIETRWVVINKGDDEKPNYRSRIVGEEFHTERQMGLVAATPSFGALDFLISAMASFDDEEELED